MAYGMGGENNAPQVSGAQRFFSRALYVFFGKPLLFLLPLVLIAGFGAYSAVTAPDEYRSIGSLNVSSDTFLGQLENVRSSDFNYETPATAVARQFNEFMQTDEFPRDVVAAAGLTSELEANVIKLDDIRATVYAVAGGDSLMRVIAVSEVPQRAQALAVSAINTYKNYVLSGEIEQFNSAESLYDGQIETYDAEADAAYETYTNYLIEHPAPVDARDERDVAEQSEITRLSEQLTRAQERLDNAVDLREQSRSAAVTAETDIDQRVKVIDEPGLPTAPVSGLKTLLTTVILYGILGLLVSIGAVAVASLLDRSVHSASDLERLGVPVLAVVPRARNMRVEPRRLAPVATDSQPMRSAG